jgi:hypothetical protein
MGLLPRDAWSKGLRVFDREYEARLFEHHGRPKYWEREDR